MIILYHCDTSRSFRALWMLEELQLPYELRMLPFPPRVRAKEYLDINPTGTVPYLIDGDVRMTESSAICAYLPVKYGPSSLVVAHDEPDFAAWLEWLHYAESTLTYPLSIALRYGWLTPEEQRPPLVADDHKAKFLGRLRVLADRLEGRDHVAADRFTSADIAIAFNFMLADFMKLADQYPPAITAYWARLRARPGFARAIEAQRQGARELKAAHAAAKAQQAG